MSGLHGEIFELSKKLSDPVHAKSELNEAMGLVARMFRDRYTSRFAETLHRMKESSRLEPPKEVALLRSLKPFMHENSHEGIDRMTEFMILSDALMKLQAQKVAMQASAPSTGGDEDIIHTDGVYEVDWDCVKEKEATDFR